jgi:hypothetical protein
MAMELIEAGVTVEPDEEGGFIAGGLKTEDTCWAASEHICWGMAYGMFSATNALARLQKPN